MEDRLRWRHPCPPDRPNSTGPASSAIGHGVGIADAEDRRRRDGGGRGKTKGHKAQIGTYELLLEHTTATRSPRRPRSSSLKTKGKPGGGGRRDRIGARQMMAGTAELTTGLIRFAADMFRSGLLPLNPQSHLQRPSTVRAGGPAHTTNEDRHEIEGLYVRLPTGRQAPPGNQPTASGIAASSSRPSATATAKRTRSPTSTASLALRPRPVPEIRGFWRQQHERTRNWSS
ncbi:hypothetical protein ACPA9J_00075 [Pseudomonas aeruginosa]